MLQLALKLPYKTLYVSGEESQKQIKLRAQRISSDSEQCYVLTETNTQQIFKQIEGLKPDILVIDSIQTLQSDFLEASAGSVSQIKQTTTELMKFAKATATPVVLIGHITKEGSIAVQKF
jgi:DNA repair protein RadA/Sms